MTLSSSLVGSWLKIRPPRELSGVYAIGYRFTDRPEELWSDRFSKVKDGPATSEAVRAMSRVLDDAVPSLLNGLGVDPKDAVFISAVRSDSSRESQGDVVTYLSKDAARKLGVLYVPQALRKNRHPSMHLSRMGRQERRDTQAQANWQCKQLARPQIFIFDDVTTSGSTFAAIGRAVLAANSCVGIYGVAFAKTEGIQYRLEQYGEEPTNDHIPARWNRLWNGLSASDSAPDPSNRLVQGNQFVIPALQAVLEDADSGRIAVRWSRPSVPDAGYELEISRSGKFWKLVDCNQEISFVYDIDTDVNAKYSHRVRASSGARTGPWSGVVDVAFLTACPTEVCELSAVPADLGTVRITWSTPSSVGRAPLLRYEVQHLAEKWQDVICPPNLSGTRDLTAEHNYERVDKLEYRVRAVNSLGPGPWVYATVVAAVVEESVRRSLTSVGRPQFASASPKDGVVEIAWTSVAESPTVSYQVERWFQGSTELVNLDEPWHRDVVDVRSCGFYEYRVRAAFMGMEGSWSYPAVLFVMGAAVPNSGIGPLSNRRVPRSRGLALLNAVNQNEPETLKKLGNIWELANLLHERSALLACEISGVNSGGLEVKWGEVPGFVPFSRTISGRGGPSEGRNGEIATFEVLEVRAPRVRQRSSGQLVLAERRLDPWTTAAEKYKAGSVVCGTVVRLEEYGAFIWLEPDITGLIHKTEFFDRQVSVPSDVVDMWQRVFVEVLRVIPARKRIGLRYRAGSRE